MTKKEPQEPKRRAPGGGRKTKSPDGLRLTHVSVRVHPERIRELKDYAEKLQKPPG
jgi:hypothetical protein